LENHFVVWKGQLFTWTTWHCFLAPPSRIPEGGAPEIDLWGWENPTWWAMMIKKNHQWFFKFVAVKTLQS